VVDDNTTNGRMDDSSDEDVKDTFDRIRKSFVRNYANRDTETADKSLKSSSSSVLEEPDKENIGFNRKKGLNKRKFLLEDDNEQDILIPVKKKMPLDDSSDEVDSDTEKIVSMKKKKILEDHDKEDKVIPIKKKSLLNDSSDEDDSFIFMKENIVSMNKKKILLEDSDDENEPIDVQSELVSRDNSDERNYMEQNNIVSFNKRKVLTDDTDEDHHTLTAVQKKPPLEDSDERDSDNERSQMDTSGAKKWDGGDKKKQLSLESSDSEEEIGMKKTKRFVNDDSD